MAIRKMLKKLVNHNKGFDKGQINTRFESWIDDAYVDNTKPSLYRSKQELIPSDMYLGKTEHETARELPKDPYTIWAKNEGYDTFTPTNRPGVLSDDNRLNAVVNSLDPSDPQDLSALLYIKHLKNAGFSSEEILYNAFKIRSEDNKGFYDFLSKLDKNGNYTKSIMNAIQEADLNALQDLGNSINPNLLQGPFINDHKRQEMNNEYRKRLFGPFLDDYPTRARDFDD